MNKTYWCGYENDKPAFIKNGFNFNYPQLFKTRWNAKRYYEDVRKVTIDEVTK